MTGRLKNNNNMHIKRRKCLLNFKLLLLFYLFMAVLGLSPDAASRGSSTVAVLRFLTACFSCCRAWALGCGLQ